MAHYLSRAACLAVAAGVTALGVSPAFAQTATSTMAVSADVTANCTVVAQPLGFTGVDVTLGTVVDLAGSLTVTCTSGTAWAASADAGSAAGATFTTRQMSDGANLLNYGLFTDTGRTQVWGDGTAASATIDDVGTGAAQTAPFYAQIAAGQQALPAGTYADQIAVTVTY